MFSYSSAFLPVLATPPAYDASNDTGNGTQMTSLQTLVGSGGPLGKQSWSYNIDNNPSLQSRVPRLARARAHRLLRGYDHDISDRRDVKDSSIHSRPLPNPRAHDRSRTTGTQYPGALSGTLSQASSVVSLTPTLYFEYEVGVPKGEAIQRDSITYDDNCDDDSDVEPPMDSLVPTARPRNSPSPSLSTRSTRRRQDNPQDTRYRLQQNLSGISVTGPRAPNTRNTSLAAPLTTSEGPEMTQVDDGPRSIAIFPQLGSPSGPNMPAGQVQQHETSWHSSRASSESIRPLGAPDQKLSEDGHRVVDFPDVPAVAHQSDADTTILTDVTDTSLSTSNSYTSQTVISRSPATSAKHTSSTYAPTVSTDTREIPARLELGSSPAVFSSVLRGTQTLAGRTYQFGQLFLPLIYLARVNQLLNESGLTAEEIIYHSTASSPTSYDSPTSSVAQSPISSTVVEEKTDRRQLPPEHSFAALTKAWEGMIDDFVEEWRTLNLISAVLVPGILSLFQITDAANDPVTRSLAFWSLILALWSLVYGCLYIIQFRRMRNKNTLVAWAVEARKGDAIYWNTWVMLALPAISLAWSVLVFMTSIIWFMWRSGANRPPEAILHAPPSTELGFRVVTSATFAIAMVYFGLAVGTSLRYGTTHASGPWQADIDRIAAGTDFGPQLNTAKVQPPSMNHSSPNVSSVGSREKGTDG